MEIAPFVLASASPRRRELLASAGLTFTVTPADVDEAQRPGERPIDYVRRVSADKAKAVAGERVLAADTIVVLQDEVLGKPKDAEEAVQTLSRLAGRAHLVMTAVAFRTDRIRTRLVQTRVVFRPLTTAEIQRYVATGESLDKAGAYGIQGLGGALVDHVAGSYTNVVGLPLRQTLLLLQA